jgi:predicted ATPase
MAANKYILTGGPGSGKTTLLKALQNKGFECSEEASRQVIIEEVAKQTDCLPWIDLSCFARKTLERMIELYKASTNSVTFFDRGIPDIIAYLKLARLPITSNYFKSSQKHTYQQTAFILPPWKEIYLNDPERWQTFEEAVVIYEALKETYQSLGFNLIELPKTTLEERVKIVEAAIGKVAISSIPG